MSKHVSASKNAQPEADENELGTSPSALHFPPPRTPFNIIADPAQFQKEFHDSVFDSNFKLQSTKADWFSDRKSDVSLKVNWKTGTNNGTPRFSAQGRRVSSEPSSTQSTPAKSSSRVSFGGVATGSKAPQLGDGRAGCSSRLFRRIAIPDTELPVDVPHFDLEEDPSFWKDHNVQVMIRIRPLNTTERDSQGYGRCLRQESAKTLVWLGHPETRFTFDHIACETISQENLFKVAGQPMVENCLSGYNSCMFAYGQTGSGKTYTMMGGIYEVEGKLNEDCGLTLRIFEHLFTRIGMEEKCKQDVKLKYSCKCSFLEIYNEQITDLLEPSSTNLQIREDSKKGVYVDNLTEHSVSSLNDVVELLLQGVANRKMAATYMNSESSRSHSVLTCIIESHWEKDSKTHFRFARLNLVDLAGSERQKSSGAEGDRLKEAANINKSLSTLGLVIMSLVDLAHGKPRHIPYRDSRLTFLLQDSLGGNSKTTVIANVSPSFCSANETGSTLKFAQRAKQIQNNAKVNECASGDETALQRQILHLKGQLSFLLKHSNFPRSILSSVPRLEESGVSALFEGYEALGGRMQTENPKKRMEASLTGALRREEVANTTIQKLEFEFEHMKRLAFQLEEDGQRTKMLLKFREEKIRQLELFIGGMLSADEYLLEENKALAVEIKMLQAKINRNPELTRVSLENSKLTEQLQVYQNFYELGEREALLTEVAELRNELLVALGKNSAISERDKYQDETMSIKSYTQDDTLSHITGSDENLENAIGQGSDNEFNAKSISSQRDLIDAKMLAQTMDSENNMQGQNHGCKQVKHCMVESLFRKCQNEGDVMNQHQAVYNKTLQVKLENLTRELEEVRLSNIQYQDNQNQQKQIEDVRQQVEMETASTIIQLQEEVETLQVELNDRLHGLAQENTRLKDALSAKNEEMRMLSIDWEAAMIELTSFLLDSSRSIRDAHRQIEGIANLFPTVNVGIGEQVQQAIEVCIEKEETILLLHKSLENARLMVKEMELKLESLKEAALALNASQQMHNNGCAAEAKQLSTQMTDENITMEFLFKRLVKNDQLIGVEKSADAAAAAVEWLSNPQELAFCNNIEREMPISKLDFSSQRSSHIFDDVMANTSVLLLEEPDTEHNLIRLGLTELKNLTSGIHADMEMHISALHIYIQELYSGYQKLVQDMMGEIRELRLKAKTTNENCKSLQFFKDKVASAHKYRNIENQNSILDQIKAKIYEAKNRLNILEDSIDRNIAGCGDQFIDQYPVQEDGWSSDCSTSSSDISTESVASRGKVVDYMNGDIESTTCLRRELFMTYDAIHKLCMKIDTLLLHDIGGDSLSEEMDQGKTPSKSRIEKAEAGCNNTSKVILVEETKQEDGFFTKFEEAQAAIKEADTMLNALLRANANAKQQTGIFKQAGEQLQIERDNLIEEVGQLKSLMHMKDADNKLLHEQVGFNLEEVANSVTSLECCISQTQREVDEKFGIICCDVISFRDEMVKSISNWKSLMEDVFLEIMGREFTSFVLHQCYVKEICWQFAHFKTEPAFQLLRRKRCTESNKTSGSTFLAGKDDMMSISKIDRGRTKLITGLEEADGGFSFDDILYENLALKKELKRKEVLLEGLLFDFRLLQESTSKTKDKKDETDYCQSQLQHELEIKASQLDHVLVQQRKLEGLLTDTEKALFLSNSKLEKAKETMTSISEHNAQLKKQVEDLYLKKSEAEKQWEEQQDVVNRLEDEIIRLTSLEKKSLLSVEDIENELSRVVSERDQLHEQVCFLTDKLDIAYALADEKEAVASEARQESEASKLYAEQKEEEVKILEHSVEELESTINMLETKVQEMDEEVEKNRTLRESLELEKQIFRQRLLTVENSSEVDSGDEIVEHAEEQPRRPGGVLVELLEAQSRIKILEEERAEQDKEIKRHKEYISELVLHADAQAMKYQQKYTNLEVMVRDASKDHSNLMTAPTLDKVDKSSARPRGSSSPFRCISNLVHQMNVEKEHELSTARLRIEELEGLATSRQKEICILNARLAAAESMTHDVIRDLLGVKLDLTKYANFLDQYEVQKMVTEAHLLSQQFREKEQEVHDLRTQINDLSEERECYKSVLSKKEAEALATQIACEKLRERDHLLSVQNGILKMENKNLKRKIVELDGKTNTLHQTRSSQQERHHAFLNKDDELTKRLAHSKMLLSRVNDEIARFRIPNGSSSHHRSGGSGKEISHG
ncbi:kinesin-like protein KIN-12C isoform X2 [Cucurbita pepo subsp. pepo]|uniref:kinesin-like protein KIN-12C isoform X2 n=1 Tax=Cucurbita pepo subsp. pepo TaxID=3664 RepID=UPI000C9DA529|nr:kinesin-like protein KIN-12C isoform X2 [Cucurbita pepo subsp. pepo]